MDIYHSLLAGNKLWVQEKLQEDEKFFERLSQGQSPQVLWIGCSDSRVPANEITRTQPGDIFVHRNIANMVVHTDINMLSVLDYAVNVLKVRHVIVCGHYGCGGVKAAMENQQFGLIDNWLRCIKDGYRFHKEELEAIQDSDTRFKRFVELNVCEQVINLSKTSIVQNAWAKKQHLTVHGWVYDVGTGIIQDLKVAVDNKEQTPSLYRFESTVTA